MQKSWVKFKYFMNKHWKDPVWSKVIATIIITLGGSIFALIYAFIKSIINKVSFISIIVQIVNYFKSTIEVNRFIFWITVSILFWVLFSFLKSLMAELKTKLKKDTTFEEQMLPQIVCNSTVFFSQRLSDSFPGQREITTYYNKTTVKRLQILLKNPLIFNPTGFESMGTPIWWFRGGSSNSIEKLRKLSKNKVLMGTQELTINKIVVNIKESYRKSYLYVETIGEKQIGLNNYTEDEIQERISTRGYCKEEFGLYKNKPISRQEYDDGSAVIKNNVIETHNSELRVRYLSDYNFIITAKQSPYNSKEFDVFSKPLFNEILAGNLSVESFVQRIDDFVAEY